MSDTWLRRFVVLAVALLIVHQIGAWMYSAFGISAGILAAVLVAAVSFFSARMASVGGGNTAWFLVPTLLFTVILLVAKSWAFLTAEKSWWDRSVEFAPFVIGFAAPVLLLLLVYAGLRNRTIPNSNETAKRALHTDATP
jgi:hypothetical protein